MKVAKITARWILDSRGNPTVEADVELESGTMGRAATPSGASTGKHEAHELRDGGTEFGGKGVNKAVHNIKNEISEALIGMDVGDQAAIDRKLIELDGTANKSRLGANAILAVSLATAHAAAKERSMQMYEYINELAGKPNMSLPMPMMNVLNGGQHARGSSDFQEFMVVPTSADSIAQALQMGSEIFQSLKKLLADQDVSTAVGDEGGFTYAIKDRNTEMLDLLIEACQAAGYKPGHDVSFAMDVASTEFLHDGLYDLSTESRQLDAQQMVGYFKEMVEAYPIVSIEDGLAEDDWEGWQAMTRAMPNVQLVGDDLLVTNTERLKKAIGMKAGNAILVKLNQMGTLSETIDAIKLAHENGWNVIVSHRSGETEDVSIAHLAVGVGAGQIKTGSLSRSERTAKYNELLRIAEHNPDLKISQVLK